MLPLKFDKADRALRVLCLGAHCDDIEIGCGGTLLQLIREGWKLDVRWVVLCSNETRGDEARASAQDFLAGVTEQKISIERFRDGFLPYVDPRYGAVAAGAVSHASCLSPIALRSSHPICVGAALA